MCWWMTPPPPPHPTPSHSCYFVCAQLKQMEVQLEEEYDEKQKVLKEKRELESKLLSAQDKVTAAWRTENRTKGDVSDIPLKPLIDSKFIPFWCPLKRNVLRGDALQSVTHRGLIPLSCSSCPACTINSVTQNAKAFNIIIICTVQVHFAFFPLLLKRRSKISK